MFLTFQTVITATPVPKADSDIEHVIDEDSNAAEVGKRAGFSRILRSGGDEEENYDRALRDSFSRILRSPKSSFSRILRTPKSSFSRILRSGGLDNGRTSSFSRILRSAPQSFSRILRAKPVSFSRILRSPSRPTRAYGDYFMHNADFEEPNFTIDYDDEEGVDNLSKRAAGFSRILRDSFSRIL